MKCAEDIFNITADNLTELILEYYGSVNCSAKLADDLEQYTKYCVSDEATLADNPFLSELIDSDKHGERIGEAFRFSLDNIKNLGRKTFCLFFDHEGRLAAFKEYRDPEFPDRFYEVEKFEYEGCIRYDRRESSMFYNLTNDGFSYFRYDSGNVAESLTVSGCFGGFGSEGSWELELPKNLTAVHTVFDGYDDCNVLSKTKYDLNLVKDTRRYRILQKYDMLHPSPARSEKDRVIDTQKKLSKALAKKINTETNLKQAVDAFFDVVSQAKPNEEEMILYEVGYYSGENDKCSFSLVRQTPSRGDEYFQMHLVLMFDTGEKDRSLEECLWHGHGDDLDLKEYVVQSKAYKTLMDKKITCFLVWADET